MPNLHRRLRLLVRLEVEAGHALGVAPGLRSLRVTALNAPKLKELGITEGPSPDRILRMSMKQTEIMKEYGLEVKAETMCYRCTCCDITPFMDIE